MINTDDFVKRLETIFDYYSLTASSFADKINVQRSSISHLLSGRNKPSLDFILKVIESFPDVELLWLLNGKGNFPKNDTLFIEKSATPISKINLENDKYENTQNLFLDEQNTEILKNSINENNSENFLNTEVITNQKKITTNSDIERIVIFYTNGTFKNYIP